jgi:hypothetical protein
MARFPRYAPECRIRINGEPLPPALRASVTSVSYQSGLEGADRVEVVLANENLQWLDHPLLQPDTEFTLAMGYAPDPLTEMFVGEITGVTASFPNGGMPTLTVAAHDFLQRLTSGAKDRAFALSLPCIGKFPLPDPQVAQLVSATNLLIPLVDPAGQALSFLTLLIAYAIDPLDAKNSIRVQRGQSDFDFLSGLARENGWEMYIDHTLEPRGYVLRFQFLIQDYTPTATFKWGESLMDFTPRLSTVGQVASVAARLYISSIKMEIVLVLGWDYDRAAFDLMIYPGLGSLEELAGSGQKQGLLKVTASGPLTAPKQILGELLPRLNNRLTCNASVVGNTELRPSRVVHFEGVGGEFSGLYRITSATHTIDSGGYRTQFEGRKEVWFGSVPIPKGASGLLRVQGQTIQ